MGTLLVVLLVALAGLYFGDGLPLKSTPQFYPHETNEGPPSQWEYEGGVYAAVPALALVLTAIGLLFGCTWCYRHKDCKPNEGAENQLFTSSVAHLHDARRSNPPDSGFSEPVNNNISEDNNNGPISLREMQNIANNNAAAYIVSENEERNRVSRESVVEFEPLPAGIRVNDPLEHCADWFGGEDLQRSRLQYLREIGRGWFGRVVEGDLEDNEGSSLVAVKILNQTASLEDKARFLDEAKLLRDCRHENILPLLAKCLQEDPWILLFELCPMDLQQYLVLNRPKMASLTEAGTPLLIMCDVTSALTILHSRGYLFGNLWSGNVLIRGSGAAARGVLGAYVCSEPQHECAAPETLQDPSHYTMSSEIWSLGALLWQVCMWGDSPPPRPGQPTLPCLYTNHLYQVMQLCWQQNPLSRPSASQVQALLAHLHSTHTHANEQNDDFEQRWQGLKPNTIPKLDEHVAIVHAPSTSTASNFTCSQDFSTQDSLSVDLTAVSRSSSMMSDKDPLSVQIKSESLNNLHGSLEDVRNIYLTHNEAALLECHQANTALNDSNDKDNDRSDSSVDPWLKDIMSGSHDDASYYRDVSDVMKTLDNILNSEKTSSSESSHQASPCRDNLILDCKKDFPTQSSMVKSPGITNFQNLLDAGPDAKYTDACNDECDRDTIGTLSHSFERHSDTISQQTLENLTPDTPIIDSDIVPQVKNETNIPEPDLVKDTLVDKKIEEFHQKELPNENIVEISVILPSLRELCAATMPSVYKNMEQLKDCQAPCDNLAEIVRTDETESLIESIPPNVEQQLKTPIDEKLELNGNNTQPDIILPELQEKVNTSDVSTIKNVEISDCNIASLINPVLPKKIEQFEEVVKYTTDFLSSERKEHESAVSSESKIIIKNGENELNNEKETILKSHEEKFGNEQKIKNMDNGFKETSNLDSNILSFVNNTQDFVNHELSETADDNIEKTHTVLFTEIPDSVQNEFDSHFNCKTFQNSEILDVNSQTDSYNSKSSDKDVKELTLNIVGEEMFDLTSSNLGASLNSALNDESNGVQKINSYESTAYMDLTNSTNFVNNTKDDNLQNNFIDFTAKENMFDNNSVERNESTVYLELPNIIKESDMFLRSEKAHSSENPETKNIVASTPKGTNSSAENTLENSTKDLSEENDLSETKIPDYGAGSSLIKLEQKCVPDYMSPLESPTKSHHTDTYDENSSVVLGPFETYNLELFKGVKSDTEFIDIHKEELLAFSSNFSEINLETPSPLRDGKFLIEVPDIMQDDVFDDLQTISEPIQPRTVISEASILPASHISPSTPPNSPGNFLASTSKQKYIVNTQEQPAEEEETPCLQNEIELNQIELQITSKLAMAENENNMNIEYSGPLTVDNFVDDDLIETVEDYAVPESYLAGNGGSENLREGLALDEECMAALRNELELKLPLAQVASIEPQVESEWASELPPPPELIVNYPGALSPIQEETGQQLSAYENDMNYLASTRTESSESYPEPCNLSTDEASELASSPPRDHSTYTLHSPDHSPDHSPNHTYTLQRDPTTSKETTMSADSLNGSPYKKQIVDPKSPTDDRTYNKDDMESQQERISQISPFILSPNTETSAPFSVENVTGVSTLSKTTVPTDAKLSKPTVDTQCLSKATSIDSWCSNDTLYNVEENFDDIAMDPELPLEFESNKDEEHSESSNTLTQNDDDKESSHCSTYIVHDSKSDACDTFSPDSITANENNTYTKVKTKPAETSPSVMTKSDTDSTRNTQTKDQAYETLTSGIPSYSNCTTEVLSGIDEYWKLPQPELVRRSPICEDIKIVSPKLERQVSVEIESPILNSEPCLKKIESVEITCLQDEILDSANQAESPNLITIEVNDSPNFHYRHMAHSATSTPFADVESDDKVVAIPIALPQTTDNNSEFGLPNFNTFLHSAELRPQDLSSNASNENHDTDGPHPERSKPTSSTVSDRTPTYSDFEISATAKPQDIYSVNKSSQSAESGISSEDFRQFENSVKNRPQDLSSIVDASSMFLNSERRLSDLAMSSYANVQPELITHVEIPYNYTPILNISPPSISNLIESHNILVPVNIYVTDLDAEDENEQPHSIIVTDVPMEVCQEMPNKTYDLQKGSHSAEFNLTFDSHTNRVQQLDLSAVAPPEIQVNGVVPNGETEDNSPKEEPTDEEEPSNIIINAFFEEKHSESEVKGNVVKAECDIQCNGDNANFATVSILSEAFEELLESNVDDSDSNVKPNNNTESKLEGHQAKSIEQENPNIESQEEIHDDEQKNAEPTYVNTNSREDGQNLVSDTQDFLQNEKLYCQIDSFIPLLTDIRFTGPAEEIMSTSFNQESPTESTAAECEPDNKPDSAADILKDWESDSDSHSSNSSSGEFIWKGGDGRETSLVPSTHFDHQRGSVGGSEECPATEEAGGSGSGSGSEGDEVEFVPSSWDCRAAPAKSSLRTLQQATPDNKKRVVFKRQKYHCVYEYPREIADVDSDSPATYLPDRSTYSEWDSASAVEAELDYGQLYGAPHPLHLFPQKYRTELPYGTDYDDDFYISSSARPFECLGVVPSSQFFPGMSLRALQDSYISHSAPSLDFTTPDSGVEDITPGSLTNEDDYKKKLPESEILSWRASDSASSSESVSPSSPGGEALGGLRHTRDKLKLDLSPSPHLPSPRHGKIFNFVLDKPKRHLEAAEAGSTPIVMTDETPVVATALAVPDTVDVEVDLPEPTFSTFGKRVQKLDAEQKIVLTDEEQEKESNEAVKEENEEREAAESGGRVKGEGTVLDSGDEDSGIESTKATLERKSSPNVS